MEKGLLLSPLNPTHPLRAMKSSNVQRKHLDHSDEIDFEMFITIFIKRSVMSNIYKSSTKLKQFNSKQSGTEELDSAEKCTRFSHSQVCHRRCRPRAKPLFMRPPLLSDQRCSCLLGPGREGLGGALLVSAELEEGSWEVEGRAVVLAEG